MSKKPGYNKDTDPLSDGDDEQTPPSPAPPSTPTPNPRYNKDTDPLSEDPKQDKPL